MGSVVSASREKVIPSGNSAIASFSVTARPGIAAGAASSTTSCASAGATGAAVTRSTSRRRVRIRGVMPGLSLPRKAARSEEHTSELQSQSKLVCRLLLEKKKGRARAVVVDAQAAADIDVLELVAALVQLRVVHGRFAHGALDGADVGNLRADVEVQELERGGHVGLLHDVDRFVFFYCCGAHRDLHSFPTRRSSDLVQGLCRDSYAALYDSDTAVLAGLSGVWKRVSELAAIDPQFASYLDARDGIKSQLEDLAFFLRKIGRAHV